MATISATFAALMPAPPTQTRPCTRVPSIVKNLPVRVLDLRLVLAVLGDVGVPVEQVGARDPHAVEPQPPVVDAVQADLRAVVLGSYAGQQVAGLVTDRHEEGVHTLALALAGHLELGEHDRGPAVLAALPM